jgi:beta-galactosidase
LLAAHEAKPTRKIVGTENGPDRQVWLAMRDHPAYSGQFLWTGIDYLGEAGEAGGWPVFANGSGLVDRTAYPRARGYERESWWLETPNIHAARRVAPGEKLNVDPGYEAAPKRFQQTVYADWTPANTGPHEESVEVYTNCEEADLLLNGVSLGRQKLHADASPIVYKVPYAAGTLVAIGLNGGKEASRDELRTAGKAVAVELKAEHATVTSAASDLVFVTATLRDENGTLVPESGTQLRFAVSGPGAIVAVDNANNADHDPFQASARKTFQGRAVVLVRATAADGKISVSAGSTGLKDGTAELVAAPVAAATVVRTF